jgi:hypothetical protein
VNAVSREWAPLDLEDIARILPSNFDAFVGHLFLKALDPALLLYL